jgi:hypothetical protein
VGNEYIDATGFGYSGFSVCTQPEPGCVFFALVESIRGG